MRLLNVRLGRMIGPIALEGAMCRFRRRQVARKMLLDICSPVPLRHPCRRALPLRLPTRRQVEKRDPSREPCPGSPHCETE